jgi:hypothetical protein
MVCFLECTTNVDHRLTPHLILDLAQKHFVTLGGPDFSTLYRAAAPVAGSVDHRKVVGLIYR